MQWYKLFFRKDLHRTDIEMFLSSHLLCSLPVRIAAQRVAMWRRSAPHSKMQRLAEVSFSQLTTEVRMPQKIGSLLLSLLQKSCSQIATLDCRRNSHFLQQRVLSSLRSQGRTRLKTDSQRRILANWNWINSRNLIFAPSKSFQMYPATLRPILQVSQVLIHDLGPLRLCRIAASPAWKASELKIQHLFSGPSFANKLQTSTTSGNCLLNHHEIYPRDMPYYTIFNFSICSVLVLSKVVNFSVNAGCLRLKVAILTRTAKKVARLTLRRQTTLESLRLSGCLLLLLVFKILDLLRSNRRIALICYDGHCAAPVSCPAVLLLGRSRSCHRIALGGSLAHGTWSTWTDPQVQPLHPPYKNLGNQIAAILRCPHTHKASRKITQQHGNVPTSRRCKYCTVGGGATKKD